jgi:hypothetical protein
MCILPGTNYHLPPKAQEMICKLCRNSELAIVRNGRVLMCLEIHGSRSRLVLRLSLDFTSVFPDE